MPVTVTLWLRAGEQGGSGLREGAADVTDGPGEGHGEGWGDGWGYGTGDAALEEGADFDIQEDFSQELDLEENLTDAVGLADVEASRWCWKSEQVWRPKVRGLK